MSSDIEAWPPPDDPVAFESLCLDLWTDIWGPNCGAKKIGRSGQEQHGVDIAGKDREGRQIGVQCKQKSGLLRSKLAVEELNREVDKARLFRPALSLFIVATTGPRDATVQERAGTFSFSKDGFVVEIWSWDDIWHEIYRKGNLLATIGPIYWPKLFQARMGGQGAVDLVGLQQPRFPDLRSITIADTNLDPASVMAALQDPDSMPARWFQWATESTPASATKVEIASELKTRRLADAAAAELNHYHAQVKAALDARQRQVDSAEHAFKTAQNEISRIGRMYKPSQPVLHLVPNMDSRSQYDAHSQRMDQYRADLAAYDRAIESLPSLRDQAAQAEQDYSERVAQLKSEMADGEAELQRYKDRLNEALDRDILEGLGAILDEASGFLGRSSEASRGFVTLLAVGCLVARIQQAVNPDTVVAIGSAFDRAMEELQAALAGETGLAIAENVLRAAQIVRNVADQNGESFQNLKQLLSVIDLEAVRLRHLPLRVILDVPEPKIPPYSHLELPADVERARAAFVEMRDFTVRRIAELRRITEEPLTPLERDLERVEGEGRKILEEMLRRAEKGDAPLAVAERTFSLLEKAESGGAIPYVIRRFSKALMDKWKEHFGDTVEDASGSRFGQKSAEEWFERQESTLYLKNRGRLPERLRANEALLVQIEEAVRFLGGAVEHAAAAHRKKLITSALWSLVPLIGIFPSLYVPARLRRLRPLVASGHKAYADVGALATRVLVLSAVLSLAIAATLVWMAVEGFGAMEFPGWPLAGLGVVGFFMNARNAWLARSVGP